MTAKYLSTMRAELNSVECDRIDEAWERLVSLGHTLEPATQPVDMLGFITDLIMRCYEARQAIHDGWCAANYRRFPPARSAPDRVTFKRSPDAAAILSESLGLSPERIKELVLAEQAKLKGRPK